MPFTVSSSREAHCKRKRRYPKEGYSLTHAARELDEKREATRTNEAKVSSVVNGLLTKWRANLLSGGSNNSMSYAGVKALVAKLTRNHPFHRNRSVFLDLGSGVGIPSIYVALRFGVRTIGVERCPDLVDLANQFAASAGVGHLCQFVCGDVCRLGPRWFCDERISHIFAFDARFGEATLQKMYRVLGRVKSPMVGCNPVSTRPFWPHVFEQVGGSSRSAKMTGRRATSFKFSVWENGAVAQAPCVSGN
jgi:SAM-dependent methyltransferase